MLKINNNIYQYIKDSGRNIIFLTLQFHSFTSLKTGAQKSYIKCPNLHRLGSRLTNFRFPMTSKCTQLSQCHTAWRVVHLYIQLSYPNRFIHFIQETHWLPAPVLNQEQVSKPFLFVLLKNICASVE